MQATFVLLLISIVESKRQRQSDPMSITQPRLERESTDFGHVYRHNIRKNIPEDFPELESSKPKKEYPKEEPLKDGLLFLSPRDQIQHEINMNKSKHIGSGRKHQPIIFDYSKLLERNIAYPSASRNNVLNKQRSTTTKSRSIVDKSHVDSYFDEHTFLKKTMNRQRSWTTCDEFKKKAVFHPDDVVNTKWLPFYIWSERGFESAVIHTLSYPTKKTVEHYKKNYGPYIKEKINWREPKLLLKERKEMLLIAGDRRGFFFGIPEHNFGFSLKAQNVSLPITPLRLKIYDPYLVMMYCDEFYATIMAELNTGPQSERDKITEAESLKFRGKGKPAFRGLEEERQLEDLMNKQKLDEIANRVYKHQRTDRFWKKKD